MRTRADSSAVPPLSLLLETCENSVWIYDLLSKWPLTGLSVEGLAPQSVRGSLLLMLLLLLLVPTDDRFGIGGASRIPLLPLSLLN